MAKKIYMARMGQTMKEGTITKWLKKDSAYVHEGDDLYEMEYDKSTSLVNSNHSGKLKVIVQEGQTVPVSTVVGLLLDEGEANVPDEPKEDAIKPEAPDTQKGHQSEYETEGTDHIKATPLVKRLAREAGVNLADIMPKNGSKFLHKADFEQYIQKAGKEKFSSVFHSDYKTTPMADKLAREFQIDPGLIQCEHRRITKEDVIKHCQQGGNLESTETMMDYREPMSTMRKTIARNVGNSYFTCPAVTYSMQVDVTELSILKNRLKDEFSDDIKLTVTDFFIKGCAKAIRQKPYMNVSLDGDEIIHWARINIGFAVALPNGLVVPVICDADKLTIDAIAKQRMRLIDSARSGSLTQQDISGGTFTITNLGTMNIDAFTPIINYPEAAILGMGRIAETPVVLNGEIVIRSVMTLSLTSDHRIIDGAPAAEFLNEVKRQLEKPYLLLMP